MSLRCSKCGSELPVETTYCPTCGNRLVKNNLEMTSNLILIYGVVAIIVGLFFAAGLSVMDQVWNDIAGPDGTYEGLTYNLMVSVVQWTAVAFLSSGVCAACARLRHSAAMRCASPYAFWRACLCSPPRYPIFRC